MFFGIEKSGVLLPVRVDYADPAIDAGHADSVRRLMEFYQLSATSEVPEHSVSVQMEHLIGAAKAYNIRGYERDMMHCFAAGRIARLGHLSYEFQRLVSRQEYVDYSRGNPYAERDVEHFVDVANLSGELWRRRFGIFRPDALAVAALYHDIDRVLPPEASSDPVIKTHRRMVDTRNVPDDEYGNKIKTEIHPWNCANIYCDLNRDTDFVFLRDMPLSRINDDVRTLIARHETGECHQGHDLYEGKWKMSDMAKVLCEADGMSFFHVILPEYTKGRPPERVAAKVRFSMEKLSPEGRDMVRGFDYDVELRSLIEAEARKQSQDSV